MNDRVAALCLSPFFVVAASSGLAGEQSEPERRADQLAERIIHAEQGSGTLGLNTAVALTLSEIA